MLEKNFTSLLHYSLIHRSVSLIDKAMRMLRVCAPITIGVFRLGISGYCQAIGLFG